MASRRAWPGSRPTPRRLLRGPAAPAGSRAHDSFADVGKEHPLELGRGGWRFLFESCGHGLRAVLAEELLRALRDRQQADDALLRLDDAAFPLWEIDAERLREAADDVEDEREALGLAAGSESFVFICPRRPALRLRLARSVVRRLAVGALERPEKERREPRVLLDGAGRAVAGLGLGGAEHLRRARAAHDLPDLLEVLARARPRVPSAVSTFVCSG